MKKRRSILNSIPIYLDKLFHPMGISPNDKGGGEHRQVINVTEQSNIGPAQSKIVRPINLMMYLEKIPGKGEDAPPILLPFDGRLGMLAVFDGMGGTGSESYQIEGKYYSGAYLASLQARLTVTDVVKEFDGNLKDLERTLESRLRQDFHKFISAFGNESSLRGKMARQFPTTMALLVSYKGPNNMFTVKAIWAGDSRGYLMDSQHGLRQITMDDLTHEADPMENLKVDSPLSNYICADNRFTLNTLDIPVDRPTVLIAATDGVFHYLPSPMHFEFSLLDSLLRSNNRQDWQHFLSQSTMNITGDDASMALSALGWTSFKAMQQDFEERYEFLKSQYISPLETLSAEISNTVIQLESLKGRYSEVEQSMWDSYRSSYLLGSQKRKGNNDSAKRG